MVVLYIDIIVYNIISKIKGIFMTKNKMLIIRLKRDILFIKLKNLKLDIKFAIQKKYYRIFDNQKYQDLLQIEKDMQDVLDAIDDRMKWV
jgi:hypothetical protein